MATTSDRVGRARLTQLPAWRALAEHFEQIKDVHLRQLFADDPRRGERLAVEGVGLYLDYSKQRVTDETLRLLVRLAAARGLRARSTRCIRARRSTPPRVGAVLHMALRAPRDAHILVDGHDVVPDVHAVLDRMAAFAERVRGGT